MSDTEINLAISNKVEPYDIFICYKETSASGTRTEDWFLLKIFIMDLLKKDIKYFSRKYH